MACGPPPTGDCSCRTTGGSTPPSSSIWVSGTTFLPLPVHSDRPRAPGRHYQPRRFGGSEFHVRATASCGPDLRRRREPQSWAPHRFQLQPGRERKTVVSGGWGMMFQPFDTQNFETAIGMISAGSGFQKLQRCGSSKPRAPLSNLQRGHVSAVPAIYTPGPLSAVSRLVDPNLQAPYAMVFSVGIQRALGAATVVDAA